MWVLVLANPTLEAAREAENGLEGADWPPLPLGLFEGETSDDCT